MSEAVSRARSWKNFSAWKFGLALFVIALAIRLWGITWGLPSEHNHWSRHPDEPVVWLYSQNIKPAEGKFTPGFYNYGTLYLTILRVSTDVVNGYGGGPKAKDGSDNFQAMARYHMAGRIISALSGAGLAWVVLLILWKRTNLVGALFGGLAVAVSPGLVIHSKFQTVDVLATFLLTAGLYYAVRIKSGEEEDRNTSPVGLLNRLEPSLRWAIASGVLIGLSAGTKYTGILGLIVLTVVCASARRFRELAFGVGTCVISFVLSTPGMIFDSTKFWRDFGYEMSHTSQGHGLVFAGTSSGFLFHLGNLALGFGTILLVLGLLGLVRAVTRRHVWALGLALFAVAYFLLIGRAEVKFLRYVFPLIPVLAVFSGWIVGQAHTHPNSRMKAIGLLGILGLGGVGGGGAVFALQSCYFMQSFSDPRASVLALFESGKGMGPGRIGLVSDPWFYTPDFYPEAGVPRWVPFQQRNAEMLAFPGTNPAFEGSSLLRYVPEKESERTDWDLRLLDQMPETVVFSSFETEGIDRLAKLDNPPDEFKSQVTTYKNFISRLQSDYSLVFGDEHNPYCAVHDLMYIRPTLWVWKRKADLKTQSSGSSITSGTTKEPAVTP